MKWKTRELKRVDQKNDLYYKYCCLGAVFTNPGMTLDQLIYGIGTDVASIVARFYYSAATGIVAHLKGWSDESKK